MANASTIPVQRLGTSAAAQYLEHLLALADGGRNH